MKELFYNNMLTFCENIALKRRRRLRKKEIKVVRQQTHSKLQYIQRLNYIESYITNDMKYFDTGEGITKSKKELA